MLEEHDEGLETWRNTSESTFYVKARGSDGTLEHVCITAGRVFHVAPRDRRLNTLGAVADLDPFSNGTFEAMELIETERDVDAIKANPAQVTDTEIRQLYAGPFVDLERRLATITNSITLRRMVAVGRNPDTGAAVAKVAAVEARLGEVSGRPAGSVVAHADSRPTPSAGVPPPQDADYYDMGPQSATFTP